MAVGFSCTGNNAVFLFVKVTFVGMDVPEMESLD